MIKLVRKMLVVIAMLGVVSTSAFAQKKDQDKRPKKEPVKVITNDRKDNNNKPPRNNDKKPKPDNRRGRP